MFDYSSSKLFVVQFWKSLIEYLKNARWIFVEPIYFLKEEKRYLGIRKIPLEYFIKKLWKE